MTNSFRAIFCFLLLAAAFAPREATANLLLNGDFTGVSYGGSNSGVSTPYFGQVGPDTPVSPATTSPASGATLTLGSWTTNGYNFVFAPGTADSGTKSGANAGQPNEAPGQATTGAGYGSTYLWGSGNGGATALPTANQPSGNFVAMDGSYEQGSLNQTISGLTLNAIYGVTFSWAAAQQQSFNGQTTDNLEVNLGNNILTTASTTYTSTSTVTVNSHSSVPWQTQTFYFKASATTQILSFLAVGAAVGSTMSEPPFTLLGGVSLALVPEPSSWAIFVGAGAFLVFVGAIRRRRAAGRLLEAGE